MKKSFKRSIAVLLSVIMAATMMPLSALAAAGEYKPDIQLQFGTFWNASAGSPLNQENQYDYDYSLSGIYGPVVDYNNGSLVLDAAKYATWNSSFGMEEINDSYTLQQGDIFTVTARLDNVNKISAFEAAISYSDTIAPLNDTEWGVENGVENVLNASLYDNLNDGLLGNLSFVDAEKNVMIVSAAANERDYADVTSTSVEGLTNPATGATNYDFAGKAVIATFVFQIVKAGPIEFGIYNGDADEDTTYGGAYYIADATEGTTDADKTTYEPLDGAIGDTDMTFMTKNEYVQPTGYTVVFKNADGSVISETTYDEGATVTIPALPTANYDDAKHYTYAWDVTPSTTATADATYTVVKTGTAHSFDYIFDGNAGKGVDGTMTGTCACGKTSTVTAPASGDLRPNSQNLALSDGIAMNFSINKTTVDKFDKVWCVVSKYNYKFEKFEDFIVEDSTLVGTRYQYQFTKMAPQNMADQIKVVFHGLKNGVEYWGITHEVTAREYIMGQLNKQSSATSTAVLYADILNYGTVAQNYTGYNTADPITSQMTATQKSWISPVPTEFTDIQNTGYAKIANPTVRWRTAALAIESSVSFKFSFNDINNGKTLTDISNIKVKVVRIEDGATFWFSPSENPEAFEPYGTEGRWNFYYKLQASNMSYGFAFTLCDANDNEISDTFSYSADSFASRQKGKSIQPLSDALVAYARSAYNYAVKGGK